MALNINREEVVIETPVFDDAPVPKGKYVVALERAVDEEGIVSKAGKTYSRCRLQFRILEGDHQNRVLFHDAIYEHPNEVAQRIGIEFLTLLHDAAGCAGSITPEGLLTGGPVTAVVDVEVSEQYGDRNVIKRVEPLRKGNGKPPQESAASNPVW